MFNINGAFVCSFRSKVLKYWRFFKLNVWVKVTMLHQVFHQSMTSLKWLFDPNFKKMLSWKGGASSIQYLKKNWLTHWIRLWVLSSESRWENHHCCFNTSPISWWWYSEIINKPENVFVFFHNKIFDGTFCNNSLSFFLGILISKQPPCSLFN